MKTIIYSCGKSMTTGQLLDMVLEDDRFNVIDTYFPELSQDGQCFPLTEWEILMKCPQLLGKTFVTVNEIPILFFMREIRKGRLRTDEVELWSGDRRVELSVKGEFIDYWDVGGFFELGFHLRFG
jgi:hypothetical protein